MDSQVVMSVGTMIAVVTFFYMWHKDSKETTKQIQKLETEVEQLKEHKQDIRELKNEIGDIKQEISGLNGTLTRIDTNVSHLMGQQR